jgi:hypothetical protein
LWSVVLGEQGCLEAAQRLVETVDEWDAAVIGMG